MFIRRFSFLVATRESWQEEKWPNRKHFGWHLWKHPRVGGKSTVTPGKHGSVANATYIIDLEVVESKYYIPRWVICIQGAWLLWAARFQCLNLLYPSSTTSYIRTVRLFLFIRTLSLLVYLQNVWNSFKTGKFVSRWSRFHLSWRVRCLHSDSRSCLPIQKSAIATYNSVKFELHEFWTFGVQICRIWRPKALLNPTHVYICIYR